MSKKSKYSVNELAEKIVGKRDLPKNTIMFDQPAELGYHCPVCKYKQVVKGNYDERLHWSEYNGMIWCSVCNTDYPSCLCEPDKKKAVETYLTTVLDAQRLHEDKLKKGGSREKHVWSKRTSELKNNEYCYCLSCGITKFRKPNGSNVYYVDNEIAVSDVPVCQKSNGTDRYNLFIKISQKKI